MSDDRPYPLVSSEVDLQDFAFMPLDVARLRDSDMCSDETPESCWAAVLLWCASWHQVPAASIPNNEQWIAKQAGYASRGRIDSSWKRVRSGALRGWVLCTDDRLYHPVVAEKAIDAWKSKLAQRWRSECGRIKKHNQRHETSIKLQDFDEWIASGCPQGQMLPVPKDKTVASKETHRDCPDSVSRETPSNRQGEGQGQGDSNSEAKASGGEPPKITDPDEIIFGYGVPLLIQAGAKDKDARSFLGGLRKHHGDSALIDKLRECIKAKPLQPLEWLAAALPPGSSGKVSPIRSPQPENFESRDYGARAKL